MSEPYIPYIYEFGPEKGRVILFFHGFPGSHTQSAMIEPFAEKYNLRILSIDRPGYGYSKPIPGGTLTTFMQGIERGLKLRGIEKFFLMGVSGGNPSAVTAAGYFGDRVLALGSVCGLAPYGSKGFSIEQKAAFKLVRRLPEKIVRRILVHGLNLLTVERSFQLLFKKCAEPDRLALGDEKIRIGIMESVELSRRQGPDGMVFDLKTFSAPWPVDYAKIKCKHLIWHGRQDNVLNFEMANEVHRLNPRSKLKFYTEDGHYSLPIFRAEEMLAELVN